jgi:hypothetical protein
MPKTNKRTPGNWHYDEKLHVIRCDRVRGIKNHALYIDLVDVCREAPVVSKAEACANGRLMAAAPDLYDALKYLCSQCDRSADAWGSTHCAEDCPAALALRKADGIKEGK